MDPSASREISLTVRWLVRFVFLTQQQRLNCVDVFISMRIALPLPVYSLSPVDCFELSQLQQQPIDAVFRSIFIRKLCYKLPSIVTFTLIKTFDQNFVFFTQWRILAPC